MQEKSESQRFALFVLCPNRESLTFLRIPVPPRTCPELVEGVRGG